MNCKQGDLTMVVRVWGQDSDGLLGVVRRVVRPTPGFFGPAWFVQPPYPNGHECIHDECLKPIRDPGDDAQDETLAWKPVPVTEQVSA